MNTQRVLSVGMLIFMLGNAARPVFAKDKIPLANEVWVVMKPLQCLSNAWEKDWSAHHKRKSSRYPMQQEPQILKQFFAARGIAVLDVRKKPYDRAEPLCKTCDCERGDTLFLLVKAEDGPKMVPYGFTKRFAFTSN
jgi:hypothetical protein